MSQQKTILLVDDDIEICVLLKKFLENSQFIVLTAHDGIEMKAILDRDPVDLIVLDLMLPGEDGISLCKYVQANKPLPVIMCSAVGEETDRIIGLEVGADDFIAKPFNPRELVARIRAILRRSGQGRGKVEPDTPVSTPQTARAGYHFAGWCFDMNTHQLLSETKDEVIELSANEVALLSIFLKNPQRVLSRDRLLDATKHRDATPFDRSIDMQISRLRQKIEENPKKPKLIKTIRGGGYTFTLSADQIVKTGT